MRNIKINYEVLNDTALTYIDEVESLLDIKNEMIVVYEELNKEWKDTENGDFKNKLEIQIEKLDYFINFLLDSSKFLTEVSNKHSNLEDNLKNDMSKVRDLYEYRDKYKQS